MNAGAGQFSCAPVMASKRSINSVLDIRNRLGDQIDDQRLAGARDAQARERRRRALDLDVETGGTQAALDFPLDAGQLAVPAPEQVEIAGRAMREVHPRQCPTTG